MSRNCKICRYQLADDWPSCPMCGASEPHRVTLGDIALEMEKHERDGWCNKKQPQPASQSASEPEQWLTQELIEKNSRGMSSTELLSFCAEFERRIRADERERVDAIITKVTIKPLQKECSELKIKLSAARAELSQYVHDHAVAERERDEARAEAEELRKDKAYLQDKLKEQVIFNNDLRKGQDL